MTTIGQRVDCEGIFGIKSTSTNLSTSHKVCLLESALLLLFSFSLALTVTAKTSSEGHVTTTKKTAAAPQWVVRWGRKASSS